MLTCTLIGHECHFSCPAGEQTQVLAAYLYTDISNSVCRRAANYSGDLLSYLRTFTSCGPGKTAGRTTQRITKVARNARRPTFAGLRHLQEVLSAVAEGLRSRCLRSRLRLSTTWLKLILGTTSLLFNSQLVNVV